MKQFGEFLACPQDFSARGSTPAIVSGRAVEEIERSVHRVPRSGGIPGIARMNRPFHLAPEVRELLDIRKWR